jgi:hypothetical protein
VAEVNVHLAAAAQVFDDSQVIVEPVTVIQDGFAFPPSPLLGHWNSLLKSSIG